MVVNLLFVLAIIGISSAFFGRLLWKSEVDAARYQLYAIRDRLILLVADGLLNKGSILFEHYYDAVNSVLRLTEKMHLEGLIEAWQTGKLSEEQLRQHNSQLEKVSDALRDAPEPVKQLVADYYTACQDMLLINSNFYSVAYLLSRKHVAERLAKWLERREPKVARTYRNIEAESAQVGVKGPFCSHTA